ncbi:hypothetical protein [Streptomyces sp. GD-15H]|uniref:hypothetical protein n=1 Tax=Streptomyces sp. GD-15H TaxID=3129112 RepID=UPI003873C450
MTADMAPAGVLVPDAATAPGFQARRQRPAARAASARAFGTQCTGSTLSPHPPAATAASSTPASGTSNSLATAHHHSVPSPSAALQ